MRQIRGIHQFHASVIWGDAIGNLLFAYRKLLRGMGYCSEIFRFHVHQTVENETYPEEEFRAWSSSRNLLLVHYSMGWRSLPAFLRFKDTRILVYHNITPAEYFESVSHEAAKYARQGRDDLPHLAKYFSAAIADSEFNAADLRQAGFKNVVIIPPILDDSDFGARHSSVSNKSRHSDVDWLFVGRLAPNKRQDDLIRAFSHYQRHIEPKSRLFLVGSSDGMELYSSQLLNLITELDVRNVCFMGKLAAPELLKLYREASVFVCLSEHEGFCIPLVEAMKSGLPIVAYNQPAVAETLQGSGILLQEKSPKAVAEAVREILTNTTLRNSLRKKQQIRVQDFEYATVARKISSFVAAFGGANSAIKTKAGTRKSPIRLACASLRYYPHIGGAEVVLQNVLERLARDGFECTVYATDAKAAEDIFISRGGVETEEWINGIRVIRSQITNPPKKAWLARNLDRISIYGHGGWSYGQFRHLLCDDYDIVHSSPFPSTHNYLAYAAASIRRKPFTCSPHLHLADAYHSDRSSLFRMMRGGAAVLANTSYERDFYVKRGVPPYKVHVTGVGCDSSFRTLPDGLIPECLSAMPDYDTKRKLIFLGRKDPHKGISDILRALRVLSFARNDFLFLCVGPETTYSRELWSSLAPEQKEHVAVIGEVSEKEKHALIRDSEILILMSTTESFGIVLLEAWLHGKPVIGARAGALQAVIQDGKDGLLVEPGNYLELAATMDFLLDNPAICTVLGANGRSKAATEYNWDRIAETWSRIFWTIGKSK